MGLYLKAGKMGAIVLMMVLVLLGGGCAAPPPPPAAILTGTWLLTTDEPSDFPGAILTFDEFGQLFDLQFLAPDQPIGGDQVLVDVDQTLLIGTVTVNGSEVTIFETFEENSFNFVGTLDTTNTIITGNLTTALNSTDLDLFLNGIPATMQRQ